MNVTEGVNGENSLMNTNNTYYSIIYKNLFKNVIIIAIFCDLHIGYKKIHVRIIRND